MNKHVVQGYVLAEDLEKRLQRVAARKQKTSTALVDTAVRMLLEQLETDDEWLAELNDRSQEYKETGLHLSHEEVSDWLRRVAKGERPPRPKAHT